MEKMIQALFNSEVEAFTGLQGLQQLEQTKDISLGETYVLTKDESGKTAIRSAKDKAEGTGVVSGGLVGGLIGFRYDVNEKFDIHGRYALDFQKNNENGTTTTPEFRNQVFSVGVGIKF